MAKVAILGAGHVGVVYAAGLAQLGHTVSVMDIDRGRIAKLRRAKIWFHEPGLSVLLERGLRRRRIAFTTSGRRAISDADFVFVAVQTPTTSDGSLDDSMLRRAFEAIATYYKQPPPIVVNKSTVPVGTSELAQSYFGVSGIRFVSNPEFLAEGRALDDFFHPQRMVFGSTDRAAARLTAELFSSIDAPVVLTDNATAEFSKLAANSFLAMKISFANALARLCEVVGADTEGVTQVLSFDARIGRGHLRAGLGFGGSCLPKDVAAVEHLARQHNANADLFGAVLRVNRDQRSRVIDYLLQHFGTLEGKRVAILGLAFKAGTDDVRESPAVALAAQLLALHAEAVYYDPLARPDPSEGQAYPQRAGSAMAAARGADAVVFATEAPEFADIDLTKLLKVMRGIVLVDGRGLIVGDKARAIGFDYFGFGRRRTAEVNDVSNGK